MRVIGSFFLYLLTACFVQNMLFCGAADTTAMLNAVRRRSVLISTAVFTSIYALLICAVTMPFDRYFPLWAISSSVPVRAGVVCAAAILWYLALSKLLTFFPKLESLAGDAAAPGAFSGAAVAAPLLLFRGESAAVVVWSGSVTNAPSVVGYCLGAGAGFALAAWLINVGMRRADNPDIPDALRGTPVMLIYIGILALALSF